MANGSNGSAEKVRRLRHGIIVLCVMLIILFVIALAVTAFLCWVSATAFSWGIVALVWLFLLVMAVFIGGGDGWE